MHHNTPDIARLHAAVAEALEALEEGRVALSRSTLSGLRATAANRGITSAFLIGALARATAKAGDVEAAFVLIQECLILDPFCPQSLGTFNELAVQLRNALQAAEPLAGGGAVARLYELLAKAGETDLSSHLAFARSQAALGQHEVVEQLLSAVTRLVPSSVDAWKLRAKLARERGDAPVAALCDRELARVSVSSYVFVCPAVDQPS